MTSNYFVFSDEAGAYCSNPSKKYIQSHPFYVRSYVKMSIDDYQQYQDGVRKINEHYLTMSGEEIKWADLGAKIKHNPRTLTIATLSLSELKDYYFKILSLANSMKSTQYFFTISDLNNATIDVTTAYKYHLQYAFQRIQMDMKNCGFSTVVMDELSHNTISSIKAACHDLAVNGDFFMTYPNLYQGVLFENSQYSVGIQLADYVVGILYCYLRRQLIRPGQYEFASGLFEKFIVQKLRLSPDCAAIGYGIICIPNESNFRNQLANVFSYENLEQYLW